MTSEVPEISVVSPVYNEEEMLELFVTGMAEALRRTGAGFELILVDDGSTDRSFDILCRCREELKIPLRIVRLARNFGHQTAITAGLRQSRGRAVIVMDCDLQDPPDVAVQFIEHWRQGYEIVYGVRTGREGEGWFKKATAALFYRILHAVADIDIPRNVGDFYLLDRRVADVINDMPEHHRFIRGLVAWVGFRKKGLPYVRQPRAAGRTKFGLWRMLTFSIDAATAFSFTPLRAIAMMGVLISGIAFLGILWAVYMKLFTAATVSGWASLMAAVLFIGGIQLLAIGVIGEYIARIGDEVKRRPLYTVQQIVE